jgi:hypothetical protein
LMMEFTPQFMPHSLSLFGRLKLGEQRPRIVWKSISTFEPAPTMVI